MNEITSLVTTVRDFSRRVEERHEAFAALVKRYQDMAFACAYAVLGDFYLAEDCAQEAFVTAWQSLDQLRAPEAFAGWLRRIVLTKCNRLVRGKRVQILPLELITPVASNEGDPQSKAERGDLSRKVLAAIRELPEHERLATTLFYVNGYTQTEISHFLDVPETTVNKRLYSARQRLKNNVTLDMLRKDLQQRRPSRNESFADKLVARLRPFASQDWTTISTITSSVNLGDAQEGEQWLRRRQEFNEARYMRRHYVAEHSETGQLLGYGSIEQTIYRPRYRLILVIEPRWLRNGVGELLLERLMQDLRDVDAVTVTFRDYESSNEIQDFLKQQGFGEIMRVNDLRLDLKDVDASSWSTAVDHVKDQGICISTLSQERKLVPQYVEKLYALTSTLRLEDPAEGSFAPPKYYEREARLWLEQPYVLPDGYFIAKDGDEYVGLAELSLLDALPHGASFSFSGVRREYRRRGIATALKVCAIEWAREQNFRTIRAFNHPAHSLVSTLNKKLGFEQKFSYVTLEKCLRAVVSIDPKIYDEYSGRYQDAEKRSDLIFTVANESGHLTVECIGQKVELFPESTSKFFCKPFYGEFNFLRDQNGRVTFLDSRVRGPDQAESILHATKIA